MAKSEIAIKLDQIQNEIFDHLKPIGYKKRGRTFNRVLDSGLIHVINFQMGKRSLNGKFTINLGVHIPEIYRVIWDKEAKKFVDHGDCELGKRIGELFSSPKDLWWDLNKGKRRLDKNVLSCLVDFGLPYLNQFMTHDDILVQWHEHGESIGLPPREGLSIAIMYVSQGKLEQAQILLISEYERKKGTPYSEFVARISKSLGVDL